MKKTLLASAIAVSALASINARADVAVTNMLFGTTNYASAGSLNLDGSGMMNSVAPFFYHTWTATQQTTFMRNTGSWAGSSASGAFDYDADIAAMTSNQVAVGIYFNWSIYTEIALLEIFDCTNGFCQDGNGVAMDNGPFVAGSVVTFSGTGTIYTPVPAAAWLMGSGLLVLAGLSRRNKKSA